ncbi:MAG: hypothetical protein H7Y00_04780 [Fimbriimonadaceae bacterium]|nr:hypothetical protein [Chitinophagales bacterium]
MYKQITNIKKGKWTKEIMPFTYMKILMVIFPLHVYAQITSTFTPSAGDIYPYEFINVNGYDEETTDYTDATDSVSKYEYYISPAGTPYEASFPSANLCLQENGVYIYYNTDSIHWALLGYGSDDYVLQYDNALDLFRYPIYITSDTSTFTDSAKAIYMYSSSEIHRNGSFTFSTNTSANLNIPIEEFDISCRRIDILEQYIDSVFIDGVFDKTYLTTVNNYYWIAVDDDDPPFYNNSAVKLKTLTFDDGESLTSSTTIRYYDTTPVSIKEPADNNWDIYYDAISELIKIKSIISAQTEDYRVKIYNTSGQNIYNAEMNGQTGLSIETGNMQTNFYVIVIENNQSQFSKPLIIYK